jgi:hypothetical protein
MEAELDLHLRPLDLPRDKTVKHIANPRTAKEYHAHFQVPLQCVATACKGKQQPAQCNQVGNIEISDDNFSLGLQCFTSFAAALECIIQDCAASFNSYFNLPCGPEKDIIGTRLKKQRRGHETHDQRHTALHGAGRLGTGDRRAARAYTKVYAGGRQGAVFGRRAAFTAVLRRDGGFSAGVWRKRQTGLEKRRFLL